MSLFIRPSIATKAGEEERENQKSHGARSGLASKAIKASITTLDTWSNATFGSKVCEVLLSDNTELSILGSPTSLVRFLLPDCLFGASKLSTFAASNILVVGNSSFPDPLARLATFMNPFSDSLLITYSSFVSFDGSLPYTPSWLSLFGSFVTLRKLTIQSCGISGSLPSKLPAYLSSFNVASNSISGTIPPDLFDNYTPIESSSFVSYSWSFASNNLSGTIPPSLVSSLPANSGLSLVLTGNRITGTIPKAFLNLTHASTIGLVSLNFGSNSIVDALPEDLWGLPLSMPVLSSLTISTMSSQLPGTIPSSWLSQYSFPQLINLRLDMSGCQLYGSIPAGLLPVSSQLLQTVDIYLSHNQFYAPIAPDFLPAALEISYTPSQQSTVVIDMMNSHITGSLVLPTPRANLSHPAAISLSLSLNSLSNFSSSVNTSKYLSRLDVSNNTALRGSIDNLITLSTSLLSSLNVGNTLLSGLMPFMALSQGIGPKTLVMDGVAVDFCGGSNRTQWNSSSLTTCSLLRTSAYWCQSSYPASCKFSEPPTIPTATPTLAECPGTPPSVEFVCINGVWTSAGTVTTPTLVISPGTSEVIVNGNVTSGTVVLQGTGSSITVTGCFTNLSVVTIQLTPEDLKKLGSHSVIELLRSDGNCSDYSTVAVGTTVSGSSCRTVKVDKATTSNGSLSGVFSVSSSGCNLWWIILVSVLAVLVIGGMIALIVILHVRKQNSISKAKSTLNG